MANKKKKKGERGLSQRIRKQNLALQDALNHPAVQKMAEELRAVKRLLGELPEAVGRAVAEAQQKQRPYGPPPVPVTNPFTDPTGLGKTGVDLQTQMGDAREESGLSREVPETKVSKLKGKSGG